MSDVIQYIGKNVKLGENVRKWHFTYIGDNTEIGDNTKIGSLVHIDYNVKIGKDCKIEGMAYIPPLTRIGDRVFIGRARASGEGVITRAHTCLVDNARTHSLCSILNLIVEYWEQ